MKGVIDIHEFMDHLERNNLVIVSRTDFAAKTQEDLQMKRARLLGSKAISIKDIVDAKLLPLKSKQGVLHWIAKGTIKETEIVRKASSGQILILTAAIKRLGYV